MNNVIIYNAPAKSDTQADIVAVWKQAVLGNASARQAFLQRIMPGAELDGAAAAEVELLDAYRKPNRAAA